MFIFCVSACVFGGWVGGESREDGVGVGKKGSEGNEGGGAEGMGNMHLSVNMCE